MTSDAKRLKGKIKEWVGDATGDRTEEARGAVEKRTGREPDEAELADETERVKESHHDYGERTPAQRVPHADR